MSSCRVSGKWASSSEYAMSSAVILSCRSATNTSAGKPPRAPSRRNEPICAWPLSVSVIRSASGTSQTSSRRRCQNGKSGFTRFRGGPKRRSKTPSSRAISSYAARRGSFRRHRPIAHNASKGLCGARHPRACQTLSVSGNCKSDIRGNPKSDSFGLSIPWLPARSVGFPTELDAGHGCTDGRPGCC